MNIKEFKNEVINILMRKTFDGDDMHLFETFDLKNYRVQEVEGEECYYEVASMPLNELLDDIYEVIENG